MPPHTTRHFGSQISNSLRKFAPFPPPNPHQLLHKFSPLTLLPNSRVPPSASLAPRSLFNIPPSFTILPSRVAPTYRP